MNRRQLKTLACIITVALGMPVSCATNKPEMAWVRTDGKRIGNDPGLLKQGQTDIAVCNANLDAGAIDQGGEIVWRRKATLLCARTKQSKHEQDTRHQSLSLLRRLSHLIGKVLMGQYPRMILASVVLVIGVTLSSPQEVLRAQEIDKPAIPPQPRTINLTQEQRFVIRENVKDLTLSKASKDAPETIGDPVPPDIVLHALPSEVGVKVPQVRSHMFFVKDGDNAIVLVTPNDRRVADVIR